MMNTVKITMLAAATVLVLSPHAFAQRTSTYPEGSIFLSPAVPPSSTATQPTNQDTQLSPRNPPDAPDAGNVSKPSDRDADNLSAKRPQDSAEKRAVARPYAQ